MLQLALLFPCKLLQREKLNLIEFSKNRCQLVFSAFREGTALQCFKLLYS